MLPRFSQTRSLSTAFDAHDRVEAGRANSRGFTHIQNTARATGTSAHHPSHTRLHTARTRAGSTVLRVHTLHGLLCRAHVSSPIPNAAAIFSSNAILAILLATRRSSSR
jgi:hypothetical protein